MAFVQWQASLSSVFHHKSQNEYENFHTSDSHWFITSFQSTTLLQSFFNLFSFNYYAMWRNGSCFKIRGYHHAQYTVTISCDTMASALLQVYQHFGTTYCFHLLTIFLLNAETLPTARHITQPSTWLSAKSHLRSHSYCLMTTKCCRAIGSICCPDI